MMPRGITPADMVVVDGIRRYPDPSTPAVAKRDDEKKEPVEVKSRPVRNKSRQPANK